VSVLRRGHQASREALAGALFGALAMSFASALACETRADVPELVTELVKRTVPEGARDTTPPTLQRRDYRFSSTWQFQLDTSSAEYRAWLRPRLQSDFKLAHEDAQQLSFGKRSVGDAYSLRVEEVEPGPPVRIRVTLEARAD
jgi:hypothetical protein